MHVINDNSIGADGLFCPTEVNGHYAIGDLWQTPSCKGSLDGYLLFLVNHVLFLVCRAVCHWFLQVPVEVILQPCRSEPMWLCARLLCSWRRLAWKIQGRHTQRSIAFPLWVSLLQETRTRRDLSTWCSVSMCKQFKVQAKEARQQDKTLSNLTSSCFVVMSSSKWTY